MRSKFYLILLLLICSAIPLQPAIGQAQNDATPPSPKFIGLNNTGDPEGSHYYDFNTTIEVEYSAHRFQAEGVVLLGSGSNLTENLDNPSDFTNFTKVSSLRDKTTYKAEINVTSYTYFYAYAWYDTINNGTMEKLDIFADQPGHQLWLTEGPTYPDFVSEGTNATERDGVYYTQKDSVVNIQYQVRDNNNESEFVTLVFGNNESEVLNASLAIDLKNMTFIEQQTINNNEFSIYEFNYTLDREVVYFSAFNSYGWERSSINESDVHQITNGFSFNETYSEDQYTDIEKIKFNITTYNETSPMSVGYQYRVFENETSDMGTDWDVKSNLQNITFDVVNSSRDGELRINSTEKRIYNATIDQFFNISNVIEIQTFVKYTKNSQTYNITNPIKKIKIIDSRPSVEITSRNETVLNRVNRTISFSFDTLKGTIDTAELLHLYPEGSNTTTDVLNSNNSTVDFTAPNNNTILAGTHTVILNVTNSLNQTSSSTLIYYLDTTAPTGNVTLTSPESGPSLNGKVTVTFSYSDNGPTDKGIKQANIYWGNNVIMDVTNRTKAQMTYRKSGEYTITLELIDRAGNRENFTTTIVVELPNPTTNTGDNPIPLIPVFVALISIVGIISYKRRKLEP